MEKEIFIVGATRTPVGDFGGSLKALSATDLAVLIMQSVLERSKVKPENIDLVFFGNCFDPLASNIARIAAVKAGLPVEVPGISISCTCGSGMQAVASGFSAIRNGEADIVLAGGVESMSNAPYVSPSQRWGQRMRHAQLYDLVWKSMQEYPLGTGMGMTAENVAERDEISREDQDLLALSSQNRAVQAIRDGKFKEEITPVLIPQRKGEPKTVDTDEHPREEITIEKLSKLGPAFKKDGSVTAGNASGINDGSAALVLSSGEKVRKLGLQPLGRIVETAVVGVDPDYMGDGPIPAIQKILNKTGLSLDNIGLFEVNEAFAAQYLGCERALGLNRDITNVNGSGIAMGHPVGCSGSRLLVTLLHEMKKRDVRYGLASLCAGGGQGFATLIEKA